MVGKLQGEEPETYAQNVSEEFSFCAVMGWQLTPKVPRLVPFRNAPTYVGAGAPTRPAELQARP